MGVHDYSYKAAIFLEIGPTESATLLPILLKYNPPVTPCTFPSFPFFRCRLEQQ